jgi:predicted nucleic-acid-binding Zn-ribbon protein
LPDQGGKLTESEKQKVVSWLKEKWIEPTNCPICKVNEWLVGDHVITPVLVGEKGALLGNIAYPHVLLICKTCGYTIFFNAVKLEILLTEGKSNAAK